MDRFSRYMFSTPKRCYILAFIDLIVCVVGFVLRVYKDAGGIQSFQDFQANITVDAIKILLFGIVIFLSLIMFGYSSQQDR